MRFLIPLLLMFTSTVFAARTQTFDADCIRIRDGVCVDKNELGYLDGASANLQTQIDAKAGTITGAATSITASDLTASRALQSDASGKVEASSTISTTELGYLDGASANLQTQIDNISSSVTTNDSNVVHITGNESVAGVKTLTGKLVTSSTTNGSIPCPSMTEAQRDTIGTPTSGDCVYNSTTNSLNVYNGALWKAAGGGLSDWETSFSYAIGDIVIESTKIYQSLEAHTSGTFATDLAAVKWQLLSAASNASTDITGTLPVANGGTGATTLTANNVVLGNGTSAVQFVAPGASGEFLKSNGTTWVSGTATFGTEMIISDGSTGVDVQHVYFGSGANCASTCTTGTCSICSQVGNKITSVTWSATGSYNVNGVDGTKYACSGAGYDPTVAAESTVPLIQDLAASTASLAKVLAFRSGSARNVSYTQILCIGIP